MLEPLDSKDKLLLGDERRPMTTTEFLDQIGVHDVYVVLPAAMPVVEPYAPQSAA
jgi:hypothetical protein